MIIEGGFEELGWRGFLQPQLEKIFPFILSTFMVGIIWFCWHLPLFIMEGTSQSGFDIITFFVGCIVFSFVQASLFKLTKNVFSSVLFHSWINVLMNVFNTEPTVALIISFFAEMIISIIIGISYEKQTIKRKNGA
jgi:membrane protease YdiL (CAAX protease family)